MTTPAAPTSPAPVGPTPDQLAAAERSAAALIREQQLLAAGDVNQANSATGIYGDTGSGKSVLLDTAIEYCWQRYHKISRIFSPDLGGFGNKRLRLIRLGICQVYNPLNHIEAFETMEDISKGYWPETILDPYTGFAAPDVRLLPPQTTRWNVYCKQRHLVKSFTVRASVERISLQCPTCKGVPITLQTWGKVEEETVQSGWIQHVGLYGFDSGTGLADWAMEDMSDKAAKVDAGAVTGNNLDKTGARINSGRYSFGANTQAHFGFAQNAVRRWIKNSRLIPGMVMPPIWTFLENRGGDENKGISVFGPKIPGDAKTAIVPSWLGNCMHTTKELNSKQIDVHRLYLVNHTDKNSPIPHLAKTRAEPGTMPAMLEDVDDAGNVLPAFTKFSLGYFFDRLDQAMAGSAKEDAEMFPDAPAFVPLDGNTEVQLSVKDLSGMGQATTARQVTAARPAGVAPPAGVARVAPPAAVPVAAVPAGPVKHVMAPGGPTPAPSPVATGPVAVPSAPRPPAAPKPPADAAPALKVAQMMAPAPPVVAAPAPVAAAPAPPAGAIRPPAGRPPTPSAVPLRGMAPPAGLKK